MAEHNSNLPDEATPIKAMTTPRAFAEASNLNAVLIEEEEPELTAKEMRQLMAKQNNVIADIQKQMSQVITLMMSREAATATDVAPIAPQQTLGEASGTASLPQQAPAELPAIEAQRVEPPGRADLSFLEQHLSPQYMERVKQRENTFEAVTYVQIPREENMHADALSKLATATDFESTRLVSMQKEEEETCQEAMVNTTQTTQD
ncbi:unnamed protein product [Linum trigynum]|uniref:Uncharacterized protein n=1 Tax=Linum trigynum TaxID=586398 RepID=A0AAV2CUP4_9ROSI